MDLNRFLMREKGRFSLFLSRILVLKEIIVAIVENRAYYARTPVIEFHAPAATPMGGYTYMRASENLFLSCARLMLSSCQSNHASQAVKKKCEKDTDSLFEIADTDSYR